MASTPTRVPSTGHESAGANSRRHERVRGPFDGSRLGVLEISVRIYDLSEGGCFVTSQCDQEEGIEVELRIELPNEGDITVKGTTVRDREGFGFGVRFTHMSDADRGRLTRELTKHRDPY